MSVQATAWAWSIRDLPPHLKITLLAIADACNAEGYGYPGQGAPGPPGAMLRPPDPLQRRRPGQTRPDRSHPPPRRRLRPPLQRLPTAPRTPPGNRKSTAAGNRKSRPRATGSRQGGNRKSDGGQPEVQTSAERQERTSEGTSEGLRALRAHQPRPPPARPPVSTASGTPGPPATANAAARPPLAAWRAHHLEAQADMIVADVLTRAQHDQQWLQGFAPMPQTYLRGARWEDELGAPSEERRPSPSSKGILALERFKCPCPRPWFSAVIAEGLQRLAAMHLVGTPTDAEPGPGLRQSGSTPSGTAAPGSRTPTPPACAAPSPPSSGSARRWPAPGGTPRPPPG